MVREDADGQRWQQRQQYYVPNRNLHLVYRLTPSEKLGQLYDILIDLVPHPDSDATLAGIKKVEYDFGRSWGTSIFTSTDRARGVVIATSAYGACMCTAELHFSDGEKVLVNRYIAFEMGPALSTQEPERGEKSNASPNTAADGGPAVRCSAVIQVLLRGSAAPATERQR